MTKHKQEPATICIIYSREDDATLYDFVKNFSDKLSAAIRSRTGETIAKFVYDHKLLAWGDPWRAVIDEALESSLFLLPMVSPLFLKSDECLREYREFIAIERKRNRRDLILPLLLFASPYVCGKESPSDNIADVVKSISDHEWENWIGADALSWGDPQMRKLVANTADRLIKAISKKMPEPSVVPALPPGQGNYIVDPLNPAHYQSLQDCLEICESGAQIYLVNGKHAASSLVLDKPVTIRGAGQDKTYLELTGNPGIIVNGNSGGITNMSIGYTCRDKGVGLVINSPKFTVEHVSITSTGLHAILFGERATRASVVAKCRLSSRGYGIKIARKACGTINENRFENCQFSSITCDVGSRCVATKNFVVDCGGGIWSWNDVDLVESDNKFENVAEPHIQRVGKN
ncbi:hypothetical protein BH11PLA1_BH11PLA1_22240 [soil metagenome]